MHNLKKLTPNVETCIVIALSKEVHLDEVEPSFYVSQEEQGQLTHCWQRDL